jgi:hypothetical protein
MFLSRFGPMFGEDAGHAGERSFRDFFRLPPTKENRRQSVDSACRLLRKFVNARCQHVRHFYSAPPFQMFWQGLSLKWRR